MNQKGFAPIGILIILVILALAGGAFYYLKSQQYIQPPQTQSNASLLSEEESLNIAEQTIATDLKISVKTICLVFADKKETNFITYTVTRKFNNDCPGDPTSAPTIPQIKVDRLSRAVLVQSLDGEFRPLMSTQINRLTLVALENAQYNSFRGDGSIAGGFKLTNGIHYTQPLAGESQSDYYQKLDTDHVAFGDINNDGVDDAIAIIVERGGGTGTYRTLEAVLNQSGRPYHIAELHLVDRTTINSVNIASGIIIVDMTPFYQTPWGDANVRQVVKFKLIGNKFTRI